MYFSRDEKEAFKAGVRKGEKNAEANAALLRDALGNMWAALGVTGQAEALKKIEELSTFDAMYRHNDREWSKICTDYKNRLEGLKNVNEDIKRANDSLFNQVNELREARDGAQRRINELVGELDASRKMGVHFRKERDTLDDFITGMKADNIRPGIWAERGEPVYSSVGGHTEKVEECANLGFATTAQILDELKRRLWSPLMK